MRHVLNKILKKMRIINVRMFWGDEESIRKNKKTEKKDEVKYEPERSEGKKKESEGEVKKGEDRQDVESKGEVPKGGGVEPPKVSPTAPPKVSPTVPPKASPTAPPKTSPKVEPPKTEPPKPEPPKPEQPKTSPTPRPNAPPPNASPPKESPNTPTQPNNTTFYEDKDKGDTEYDFIPTKDEEPPEEFLYGCIRLISFAPIIVSFLSLSHLIRKIPKFYLLIGCFLASIHFILSFLVISDLTNRDDSKISTFTSISYNSFPLSVIVDIYLLILKFLTCIFLIDMFLESIYSLYPDFRIDDYPFGSTKIIFLILIAIFLVFLVYISRNVPMVLFGSNIAILIAGILFLICIMIYSRTNIPLITKNTTQDFNLSTNLFLCFSFLCFACESHSMTVSVFKKGRSSTLLITLISVISIFTFLFLLIYFGDWILDFNLKEALNLILPSNQNQNFLLPYTTFLSCLIISLLGFVLQLTVLNKSLISIFVFLKKASSLIEFIIVFVLVTGLVWLVLIRDIGRFLWWTTKFLYFGFPFYAMYPYCCGIINRGNNQAYFVFSAIGILILCYFVFLAFMNVSVLNPKYMN